jgi:hypothetical protein
MTTRTKRNETTYTILISTGGTYSVAGEIIAHSPRLARTRAADRIPAVKDRARRSGVTIVAVPGRSWKPSTIKVRSQQEPSDA